MAVFVAALLASCVQQTIWHLGSSSEIVMEECLPPDYPQSGGYGPEKSSYLPGDEIHYYCDPGTFIGGNYRRICFDNGDWSGDTPVCDEPAIFAAVEQSSTAQPENRNDARRASDGDRSTCSQTLGEENGATWTGILRDFAREAIRFMLFLPKGQVSYEVFIVRSDGSEVSCGRSTKTVVMYEWVFHNCLQPNNTGVVAVKVKSLTKYPLEICELVTHTLTDPTCVDPHFEVDNGRLILSRKAAVLVCDDGYTKWDGSPNKLDCMRTGVWSRRSLFCEEKQYELEEAVRVPSVEDSPAAPGERVISVNKEKEREREQKRKSNI